MITVDLEYGDGRVGVDLPDSAVVVRPGETYVDPPPVDPAAAVRRALAAPLGLPPLRRLVGPASRVAIAFPDRVKGGAHPLAHRRVALPIILGELAAAGVDERRIRLVCAVGLHRKNTAVELAGYLPDAVLDRFGDGRLANHDAEDPAGVVHLGNSRHGDPVAFNRTCAEADLCVVLGHVQGNPYGGFSGGHKSAATGLTTWQSIAGHHVPASMHRADFVPVGTDSHFRDQLRAVGQAIEQRTGKPLFAVDAVLGDGAAVLGVHAGAVDAVEAASWPLARRRTEVELDIAPADVLLVGLPRSFHYGPGMGTNPILMAQAVGAVVARCARALRPGGVVVAAAECDGWFNDDWFPSYRETYERFVDAGSLDAMGPAQAELCARRAYVDAYRHCHGYHPFHAFSMLSMAAIGLRRTARVYVAGARSPAHAEAMGFEPTPTVAEALRRARRHVGGSPRLLALPEYLTHVPPHLSARRG